MGIAGINSAMFGRKKPLVVVLPKHRNVLVKGEWYVASGATNVPALKISRICIRRIGEDAPLASAEMGIDGKISSSIQASVMCAELSLRPGEDVQAYFRRTQELRNTLAFALDALDDCWQDRKGKDEEKNENDE